MSGARRSVKLSERSLITVGGRFWKIAFAGDLDLVLTRGTKTRPPARFNRTGEDALYISPDATSAMVAIGQYVRDHDPPRVLVALAVSRCKVLDLRHPEAAEIYELARTPWLAAHERGEDPLCWRASDFMRANGVVGLIDPSKRRSGLWALTLFRWNEEGAPSVTIASSPVPVVIPVDFR